MNARLSSGVFAVVCCALPLAALAADMGFNALRISDAGPLTDPAAAWWQPLPEVKVPILPQTITLPRHPEVTVKELRVRAAHNGHWLAFLIEWKDPTQSDRIVVDAFGDQVAIELPVKYDAQALPAPMMGNPGGQVSILQWRAAFQSDLEKGEPTVRDLYPFAHVDVYPDEVLRATDAAAYTGALGLDNPVSHPVRTAVLDQMAEGWGTLTVRPEQHGDGRGVWKDGVWRVVITHPLQTENPGEPRIVPGTETAVAFAVWEGGAREVGSRKGWTNWVTLKVEQ